MSDLRTNPTNVNSNYPSGKIPGSKSTTTIEYPDSEEPGNTIKIIKENSFDSIFSLIAIFILIFGIGIVICFYAIMTLPKKDNLVYIFLAIIVIGILSCFILFRQIYSFYLVYCETIKKKSQLSIEVGKLNNIRQESKIKEDIKKLQLENGQLRKQINDKKTELAREFGNKAYLFSYMKHEDERNTGYLHEAEKNYKESLGIYKELDNIEPNHKYNGYIARTFFNIARVQFNIVKIERNIVLLDKVIDNCEKALSYYKQLYSLNQGYWGDEYESCELFLKDVNDFKNVPPQQ